MSKYTEDEWVEVISDETHYFAYAEEYAVKHGEICMVSTTDCIGFIHQQDTTFLNRNDGTLFFRIVLFDGKTKPAVIAPIDISNNEHSWFFKK